MTGLSPAEVSSQHACAAAPAGYARCEAQVLVARSSGARVHPSIQGGRPLAQVQPALSSALASPQAVPAQPPPQPGTPAYLQQAYDLSYLSATNGGSDTIAVVDAFEDPTAERDLATFRSKYGLPDCTTANGCFRKANQSGGSSPPAGRDSGWEMEEAMDVDAVSALCPKCRILLVEANSARMTDLATAVQTAAGMGANQLSLSWSSPPATGIPGTYTFPGVATIAAAGDSGYLGISGDSYPAAYAGVTAAGGTTLASTSSASQRGYDESAWSGAGSGCDLSQTKPSYQADVGCAGRA